MNTTDFKGGHWPMKLLLIGVGRWGRNHLKALMKLVGELYVVDSNPDRLKACKEFSISVDRLSTHYQDFLDRVDAVNIVTPADSHLILQVGHIYRYHLAASKIKDFIESGRLGAVQYAYGHFIGFKRPRMDVEVTNIDTIHYFDLFNYLLSGPPRAIIACDFQKNSLLFYENRHEKQGERWLALEREVSEIPFDSEEPLRVELEAFLNSMR